MNCLTTRANNQFVSYRISVKEKLKIGINDLLLYFESAFCKVCSNFLNCSCTALPSQSQGRDIEKQHGKLALWNGDSSRLHVRKAQYKFGHCFYSMKLRAHVV